jgi:hypothetical protein
MADENLQPKIRLFPTTYVQKGDDGDVVTINVSDLEAWEENGYEEVELELNEDADAADATEVEVEDLSDYTVHDLRARAVGLGVINAKKLSKAKLIDAITEIESDGAWTPEDEETPIRAEDAVTGTEATEKE